MVTLRKQDQEQLEKARDLLETDGKERGFVRSLFFGQIPWEKVIPYPKPSEEDAARTRELVEKVEAFMRDHVDPDEIDATERLPQEVIEGMGTLGVLGMTVPRAYGGGGYSHTAYCRVLEAIAKTCASTAVFVGAHQSIGLKAVVLSGSEEQKRKWLPDLASGKTLAAFCLSEPEVGSDAANVQTQARLSDDGSHWIINGQKKYATNGALAGLMTVMARTPVQDNGSVKSKVTAFIVTPDMPGFEVVSNNRSKCGIRGTWQATLRFTDMRVPRDHVLGELGRGLRVALTVLNYGRCTLSAGCLGGARVAMQRAIEHARTRRQFDRPIGAFHLVKKKIARMAELVHAMDAMTYLSAGLVDRHDEDLMLETAICKLFCSEASWRVLDDAVQIMGGEGYMREHGLERGLRDARINRIVEGTTEVMTSFIALTGMKGVGEELEQTLKAMRHPVRNFGRLTAFLRHEWRDVLVGHGHDNALLGLHGALIGEGRTLTRMTKLLARDVSRLLAKHKMGILDLQLLQQRITWTVVDLYATAAIISRLQALLDAAGTGGTGELSPWLKREVLVGKAFCHHAAERIARRRRSLYRNLDEETIAVADEMLDDAEADQSA
ncbi:MAG: acyl-CoA dehydrogenase family protein [Phycisphaeraceae bacterium]